MNFSKVLGTNSAWLLAAISFEILQTFLIITLNSERSNFLVGPPLPQKLPNNLKKKQNSDKLLSSLPAKPPGRFARGNFGEKLFGIPCFLYQRAIFGEEGKM